MKSILLCLIVVRKGGVKLQILVKKTTHVYLIVIRENDLKTQPPILRNLDNFRPLRKLVHNSLTSVQMSCPPPDSTCGWCIFLKRQNILQLYETFLNLPTVKKCRIFISLFKLRQKKQTNKQTNKQKNPKKNRTCVSFIF